ncbi:MAG TPA: DUF4446 domain-containing protein [Candidatus Moranbacteria bacterium]|nr:DUF4446 domain-containing protein [Candidatus Moranbacteria bacterium]HAT75099.1 DUF4446 domain-containing protein [Candidatus Moranbacteria bacterium]
MESVKSLIEENLLLLFGALFFLSLLSIGWTLFLQLKLKNIQTANKELFRGGKIPNLEELLLEQAKNLKNLDKDIQELFNISNKINALALKSLHKFAVVRFNPFKDTGGNQSFSIALLDGKNNGLTITALYTREGTRVYAKSIANKDSKTFPLTDEEKQAIEIASGEESKKKK